MRLLSIIICVTCISCGAKFSVAGLYGKCQKRYLGCQQLQLNKDRSFEYYKSLDTGGEQVLRGSWRALSEDTLVLNTFQQPRIPKTYYVGEFISSLGDKLEVHIQDYNEDITQAIITINDSEQTVNTDHQGKAVFNSTEIKTISYNILDRKETISIANPKYNYVVITVKDLEIGKPNNPYITNDTIIVKSKGIKYGQLLKRVDNDKKQWE